MGLIIVIDGLDGSGKATQAAYIHQWLLDNGYNAHKISFPDYDSDSSFAVKMYLNGELGVHAENLNPYMCSTFYAIDRAIQYIKRLKDILNQKDAIIISDRYISANIIHQGGKLVNIEEREEFFKWLYDLETNKMGIPKEDITIFLEMPVWKSQELMTKRYKGDEGKKDIHESNIKYLEMCYESSASAIEILNKLGYRWDKISCLTEESELKTREVIFEEILTLVKTLL